LGQKGARTRHGPVATCSALQIFEMKLKSNKGQPRDTHTHTDTAKAIATDTDTTRATDTREQKQQQYNAIKNGCVKSVTNRRKRKKGQDIMLKRRVNNEMIPCSL